MKFHRLLFRLLALLAVIAFGGTAHAKPGCNDAAIFGSSLITDICWSCVLPIKIGGIPLAITSSDVFPPGSNTMPLCNCPDPLGIPSIGFSVGAWLPYRLFETVRNPYCMPVLGGIFLNDDWLALAGPNTAPEEHFAGSYYHTHVYSFPLATMMELITSKECNPGGWQDMDLMMLSELDPVASDDLLAMFIYFETAMFANPLTIAACGAECSKLTAGFAPSTALFYCAGCWGSLYPMTNSANVRASKHSETSLLNARQLAVKHRRGLGHKTYGSDAMCGGKTAIFLPKEQYKWQHLFPVAQANKPCCHWTGASEYVTGGVSRERP